MNSLFYRAPKDYGILLYETLTAAQDAEEAVLLENANGDASVVWPDISYQKTDIEWWSVNLGMKVRCIQPNEVIFVFEKKGKFWRVITGEMIGWLIMKDWLLEYVAPLWKDKHE